MTFTEPILDETTELDEPKYAHIIKKGDDDRPAYAIILEARVMGLVLVALCGHAFVPERDPAKYPVCDKCLEMLPFEKALM